MSSANKKTTSKPLQGKRAGLFATCLIDLFRPNAAFSAAELIEQTGCSVHVPEQACCGQANFNGGDNPGARGMALRLIHTFTEFDYVVVPSASCAAMIRVHYIELFAEGSSDYAAAAALANKTFELTEFLVDEAGMEQSGAEFEGAVVMHHACSALRELQVRSQPEALLDAVTGLNRQALKNPEVCCGFGGTFCVKYPEIADRIAARKIADIEAADGVDTLVSTDLGCLMHLAGKMSRDGSPVKARHIAEILAGRADEKPL